MDTLPVKDWRPIMMKRITKHMKTIKYKEGYEFEKSENDLDPMSEKPQLSITLKKPPCYFTIQYQNTWKETIRIINAKITFDAQTFCCEICEDEDNSKKTVSCNRCAKRTCLKCYVQTVKANRGQSKCCFCRYTIGAQLPARFLLDTTNTDFDVSGINEVINRPTPETARNKEANLISRWWRDVYYELDENDYNMEDVFSMLEIKAELENDNCLRKQSYIGYRGLHDFSGYRIIMKNIVENYYWNRHDFNCASARGKLHLFEYKRDNCEYRPSEYRDFLKSWTKAKIVAYCKMNGIKKYSKYNKAELITYIMKYDF